MSVAVEIAGHRIKVRPTPSGAKWLVICTCGYVSTTRAFERLAVVAAVSHQQKVVAKLKESGLTRADIAALTRENETPSTPWPDENMTDAEFAHWLSHKGQAEAKARRKAAIKARKEAKREASTKLSQGAGKQSA